MKSTGFTLIEVLVTVAIVGILTSIGLPAYRDYIVRGKIPEATAGLASKQIQLEQTFQDSRTYVGASGCLNDSGASQFFNFSCSAQSATTFTLEAVGKNSMAGFTFTLNQSNQKTTAAVPSGWTQPNPNNCWVTKKGGAC